MFYNILFAFICFLNSDTMKLPIKNGMLIVNRFYSQGEILGTSIRITSDNNLYSCSKGKVISALKLPSDKYSISIKSANNVIYCYSNLDSVCVIKGQRVNDGQVLGKKEVKRDDDFIVFSVYKNNKEINAQKFITYSDKF